MRILLVDPDGDRATTLGRALAAAGAHVTVAASGSFALTMLEWDPHDVVLSRVRVGDMDAAELCQILRDDPGMKELRFALVVWPDERSPKPRSSGVDLVVPSTMSAPTMLERIGRLLPAVPVPAPAPPEPSRSFAGSLHGQDLGDHARAVAAAGRTGHLLVSLSTVAGAVAFEAGRVVHAECRDETGREAFVALFAAARAEAGGEFCFVADESGGLRGTPRTIQQDIEALLGGVGAPEDGEN